MMVGKQIKPMTDEEIDKLNEELKQISESLFGKKQKSHHGSTRNAKEKTGRYWVYRNVNDIPIGKVCQECRSNYDLIEQHYGGKLCDDIYIAHRRNKDKCDICNKI